MRCEVVGFGLAGACVALRLLERGVEVRVVDDGVAGSSVVAAGLVNPVPGRNFEPGWDYEEAWGIGRDFYGGLDGSLFHEAVVFRRWLGVKDREKFERKREVCGDWVLGVDEEGVSFGGGGWLETGRFLEVARGAVLAGGGEFVREKVEDGRVRVFCTGARGLIRGEFRGVEHRCAKGEILTVRVEGWDEERILTGGGWCVPVGGGRYRVGSTYVWDGLESGPSEEGRERVEEILRGFTGRDFVVEDHVAGVRPIVSRSEPVIGYEEGVGWMLNGLGSKGVLYGPRAAGELVDKLVCEGGK